MKKILFIGKYTPVPKSGFESRLYTIIKYFAKNKYQVTLIAGSKSLSLKQKITRTIINKNIDGVNCYFIKDFFNYSLYSFKRILGWILFEYFVFLFDFKKIGYKPDIIYISSLSLLTILNGVRLKKKFNAKLVFEMRDLWPYFLYTTKKFSRLNPFVLVLDLIEKYGIANSDLIVGLVPRIKQYINYRGFFNKKTLSSTFPVNKKKFLYKKNLSILNLDKSKFNVCYAGNFGFDNHLESLLNLIKNTTDKSFVFHFFGEGSLKTTLMQKFSSVQNVIFYEYIHYDKLHSILIKMQCLILSFGFEKKYPTFGYELNKLNNYLMSCKPIIIVGSKKNLSSKRGYFTFVSQNSPKMFYNKLNLIKKKYNFFLQKSRINKKQLLLRNDPEAIFNYTCKQIDKL